MPERKGSGHSAAQDAKGQIASSSKTDIPVHVAIIMDGNGRWAEDRGLSRLEGHRSGTQNTSPIPKTVWAPETGRSALREVPEVLVKLL